MGCAELCGRFAKADCEIDIETYQIKPLSLRKFHTRCGSVDDCTWLKSFNHVRDGMPVENIKTALFHG
jgi:hypothetical protein